MTNDFSFNLILGKKFLTFVPLLSILVFTNLTMEKLKLNHYAIWLAIALQIFLGILWYGPVFGARWKHIVGLDVSGAVANYSSFTVWFVNILSSAAAMYLLAWLLIKVEVRTPVRGLLTGFLIAFTFNFLSTLSHNIIAQFPYELAWITGGLSMVGFSIAGFIFGIWTKQA